MIQGKRMIDRWTESVVPDGAITPLQPLLELCGDRRVLLEHYKGLCEYTTGAITVKVKYGALRICGTNLKICTMNADQLVITGCIETITVLRGSL